MNGADGRCGVTGIDKHLATCMLLLVVGACSRTTPQAAQRVPPRPRAVAGCTDSFAVTVSPGVVPRFTWSPDCTVSSVAVQVAVRSRTGWETVWSYHIPDPGGVASGIEYGVAPPDAIVTRGPKPLQPGKQYLVTVRNVVAGSIRAEGEAAFRP